MAIKTYNRGSAERLAPNFRAREFDCPGKGCCKETKIDEKLVGILQKIRDHFGKPVIVTAYRCQAHNGKVANAASRSYHIYGRAADIHIDGVAPAEIAKYAESIGVLGIGLYETDRDGYFVHVDTRSSKSFWYGHGGERRMTFGAEPAYSLEQFREDVRKATGEAGELTGAVTVSARKNRKHPVVKPIQKRLAALGYTQVGDPDGVAGAKFTAAVLAFQADHSCRQDGEITARNKTWRCLLEKEAGV